MNTSQSRGESAGPRQRTDLPATGKPVSAGKPQSEVYLDALRGLAALAVVVYHIRARFFADYTQVEGPSHVARLFYTATAFGHDAVMVFFVLSGYLISGTVLRAISTGRWSWGGYLTNRFTRLYVVVLPGLLLTLALDVVGLTWFGHSTSYTGAHQPWIHDYFNVRAKLSGPILAGNVFFLQEVLFPTFGSNGPLWSLAYEVGYYLLFPFLALAVWPTTSWPKRLLYGMVVLGLSVFYRGQILNYAPVWLFGAAVWLLPAIPERQAGSQKVWGVAVPFVLLVLIGLAHMEFAKAATGHSMIVMDYITGIATALSIYLLRGDRNPMSSWAWPAFAGALARVSFTLYIVHYPLLVFIRGAFDGPAWMVNGRTLANGFLLLVVTMLYAWGVWILFEARTDRVREYVRGLLTRSRVRPAAAVGSEPTR